MAFLDYTGLINFWEKIKDVLSNEAKTQKEVTDGLRDNLTETDSRLSESIIDSFNCKPFGKDVNLGTWNDKKFIYTDGAMATIENWSATNYIALNPKSTYTIMSDSRIMYALYNADKTFIRHSEELAFTTEYGEAYLRLSTETINKNNVTISYSNSIINELQRVTSEHEDRLFELESGLYEQTLMSIEQLDIDFSKGGGADNGVKWVFGIIPKDNTVYSMKAISSANAVDLVKLEKWVKGENGYSFSETITAIEPPAKVNGTNFYMLDFGSFTVGEETLLSYTTVSDKKIVYENITGYSMKKFDKTLEFVHESDLKPIQNVKFAYELKYGEKKNKINAATEKIDAIERSIGKYVIVDINGSGDYTSIVDAVNNEPEGTPIILMEGVYNGTIQAFRKKINIRGTDRNKCIIRSTDGRYENPAINASIGYLENLTIYSQYVQGVSTEISEDILPAYAIHNENEYAVGGTFELHHCTLKSDFFSALGLGLRKDHTVILDDCILESAEHKVRSDYPNGLGALYFHDSIGAGGDSRLIVKNCLLKSKLGYTLCPYMVNQPQSGVNHVYTTFVGNVLYDKVNGYLNNIYFRNDPYGETGNFTMEIGYGNSNNDLNIN